MTAFLLFFLYNNSMIIYIDIVFIENVIMNYLILFCLNKIKNNKRKNFFIIKMLISSIIGAIFVILFLLKNNIELNKLFILKMIIPVLMVYIAFDLRNIKELTTNIMLFYLISFVYGGIALMIESILNNIYLFNSKKDIIYTILNPSKISIISAFIRNNNIRIFV